MMIRLLLSIALCFSIGISFSQTCQDASVELSAVVQKNPPVITLHWVANAGATGHIIYRKAKNATAWGAVLSSLPGAVTEFIDTTVEAGVNYEYRVVRQATGYSGYGYINSGIEIPAVENRGWIILLIDNTLASSLRAEWERWIDDVKGDGWQVDYRLVNRSSTPAQIKTMIKSVYDDHGTKTKALFILGHVPVPYSGDLNPDGHPDHLGAWPADVYYADMNGTWTDNAVNDVVANDERNDNIPGDGKFDQSVLPSDVELQVGRVDFANMPSFAASEEELLRNYLNKDHAFRFKLFTPIARGVVDDNFGYFSGEAFASSGYKNIGPIVGPSNVIASDYLTTLADSSYLWSYGCGGGWFQGAGGVGSTGDFANAHTQSVFTMLFGSYFGDWDSQDNFLRAPLAQGLTLTNAWSGRPHWLFHHMALGETVGYAARTTQNNNATYFASYGARFVSIALMGDPTLRNNMVAPPANLSVAKNGYHAVLTWEPSAEEVLGYNIYRQSFQDADLVRINSEMITSLTYVDSCLTATDSMIYMVRAVKLEHTPSGSYFNLSHGASALFGNFDSPLVSADANYKLEGWTASFSNTSTGNINQYLWQFGDGTTSTEVEPTHNYTPGEHVVSLIVSNSCFSDTIYLSVSILTGTQTLFGDATLTISPNPSTGKFNIHTLESSLPIHGLHIYSAAGKVVRIQEAWKNGEVDLTGFPRGLYMVQFVQGDQFRTCRIVLE